MHAIVITLTVAAFLFFAWLLIKQFVLSSKWYFSDLFPLVALSSIPMALVARSIEREGYTLDPLTVLFAACVGSILDIPIFIGAWWGLRVSAILHEERALPRMGLLLIGKLFVAGALAWCASLFNVAVAVIRPAESSERVIYFGLFFMAGFLLLLPGFVIEMRCRKLMDKERASRIVASRAARKRKRDEAPHASPSDANSA